MLGKTHMMVGMATALLITQPEHFQDLILCVGASSVGALISDIDVGTSDSHRDADKVVALTFGVIVAMVVADFVFHLGIMQVLERNGWKRLVIGVLAFIGICAFGKEQPHRSFMHSFLAMVLLSACIWVIVPNVLVYFILGFLSHLAIDLFNHKRVQLLYPLPGGMCLGLFHAHGLANTLCFFVGTAGTVVGILRCLYRMMY